MKPEKKRGTPYRAAHAGTFAYTRTNERGEVELIVKPSRAKWERGRSRRPRSKEEILAILKAHGLR
jgi:hypothetical protein